MIITKKRVTSKDDTPPGTDSQTQVEVEEKKAPGFREKVTKSSTASVTTSENKPILSPKVKKTIKKGVKNIEEGLSDSFTAVKDAFKR